MVVFWRTYKSYITWRHTPHQSKTTSLYGIVTPAANNCSKWARNTWMCFVTVSFSFIFRVWHLSFRYILVTTSWDSNNFINYAHANVIVLHDWICETTLLSRQLSIIVRANVSLSSYALMLHVPATNKEWFLAIIWVVVGATV